MKLYCSNLDEMCGGCIYWSPNQLFKDCGWGQCSSEHWTEHDGWDHDHYYPYVVIKHNKSDPPCLYRQEISSKPVEDWLFEEDKCST